MSKIRLDIEDLAVESFDTAGGQGDGAGTVHGREFTVIPDCRTVGSDCRTVQTGNPECPGCQVSGNASCVWCPGDTNTCYSCSWTDGVICVIDCSVVE